MAIYRASRLHPYSKLLFLSVVTGLALSLPRIFPLASLLILAGVTFLAGGGGEFKALLAQLSPFRYIIPILFVLNSVFYSGGETIWNPYFLPLNITEGGLLKASVITLRLMVVAAGSLWFARSTEAEELEVAFTKLGLPWKLSFVLSLTMRLVPEFKEKFRRIKRSQVSRGLKIEGPPWRRIEAQLHLIVPFLAAIGRYGYELGEALKARGFESDGKRSFFLELEMKVKDYLFCLYSALLPVLFILKWSI